MTLARRLLYCETVPSLAHEVPIALLRAEPEFLVVLLRDLCQIDLPPGLTAEVLESDFTEVTPLTYHADLVVELRGDDMSLGVIVEVQRAADPDKRYTWPLYAWSLAARRRGRVCLLVLTGDDGVAEWAETASEVVLGNHFRPLVVGPSRIPWIRTVEEATRRPELALLSALAHDDEPGGEEVVEAALAGVAALDGERRFFYHDWLIAASEVTRRLVEEQMKADKYQYPMSDFARLHYGRGKVEGQAEGEAKGEAKGEARGKVEAVLAILATRGLVLNDVQRARISGCTNLPRLDRWLVQAVHCTHPGDLFADGTFD